MIIYENEKLDITAFNCKIKFKYLINPIIPKNFTNN